MQADWEFDVGTDAPVVDAHWAGLVDLRQNPAAARSLPETAQLPALAEALTTLNKPGSALWTAKCDVWAEPDFNSDELDAPTESAVFSLACYIDLLSRESAAWSTPDGPADWCRRLRSALADHPLWQCRADLVIRTALLAPDSYGFAVTAYLIGCGASAEEAAVLLSRALSLFADSAVALSLGSKYNENNSGE